MLASFSVLASHHEPPNADADETRELQAVFFPPSFFLFFFLPPYSVCTAPSVLRVEGETRRALAV